MKNTNLRTLKSKRVHRLTLKPDWMLKIQGKRDSHAGEAAVNSQIRTWCAKENAFEHEYCVVAEKYLDPIRKECRACFFKLSETLSEPKAEEAIASSASADSSGLDPIAVRALRRKQAQAKSAEEEHQARIRQHEEEMKALEAEKKSASLTVAKNAETLADLDTLLSEKVDKQRVRVLKKMRAYLVGVRRVMPDFEPSESFYGENAAYEIYKKKHASLDEAVAAHADRQLAAAAISA